MNELFENNTAGASFSADRKYRFALWRIWDETKPLVMIIGLNPSKADEGEDDPTIKSVCRVTKFNGYGGFYMMNCWAYIATNPDLLKINPISESWNNDMITAVTAKCKDVVFAWGNFKILKTTGRAQELISMFPRAKAFDLNKNGSPKHPLYCRERTPFISYKNQN